MADNWGFVAAAYGLTAVVLLVYWRRLGKKEQALEVLKRSTAERSHGPSRTERLTAERSREPSSSGHPRSEPGSWPPLQS